MRYCNLHTHTSFSDGNHSPEENVISAIESGMVSLGFSDHCYTYFDTSYCVQKDEIYSYINEIRRLKEIYSDKIEIYLGLELDGFAKIDERHEYDYIIGDIHYVRTPDGLKAVDLSKDELIDTVKNYFDGDYVKMARSYYESYVQCIEAMRPDVLGHIDLVTKYSLVDECSPEYIRSAKEALEASLKITPVIELNTGAMSRGYRKEPYPAVFLIDSIKDLDGKILLSSDSHDARNLTYYFDDSVELLRSRGIKSIVSYERGDFKEVKI